MSSPAVAYKGASQHLGLWLLFSFLGVAFFHLAVFFAIHTKLERTIGGWAAFTLALSPLIGMVVAAWRITSRLNRERIQRVATRLADGGFTMLSSPTEDERAAFAAPLAHLLPSLDLRHGATGIQWCAVQQTGTARLFEHRYTTGSGKTLQEHYHTVIAWPAGHPELSRSDLATAPWFYMVQYHRFIRRDVRKHELQVPELGEIAARWSLFGDATTARRFLTPAVQLKLADSPRNETWCMGAGFVCCKFKGIFDAANLDRFLAHARAIVAIPAGK